MKVTIVGGGLVGSLAGCLLGKRGHDVELFEYRPDPAICKGEVIRGRSINLTVSNRGWRAIAELGVKEKILETAVPMKGRMLHFKDCSKKEVLYDPFKHQCIYSVSRATLNDILHQELKKLSNVKIHFEHKLISAVVEKGETHYREKNGNNVSTHSDLIIGADGAHSALRQCFLKRPLTNYSQIYIEHGYVELYMPPVDGNQLKHAMEMEYLHIWPRDGFMLIALPNRDGSFTMTLFMPFAEFRAITTREETLAFFKSNFADIVPLVGEERLTDDFLRVCPSPLMSISCFPLNAGKAVLVGDAAHVMVPFFGQGMNTGFEDITILDQLLQDTLATEVEVKLKEFSDIRFKDSRAISQLSMFNYEEMRHLVNKRKFYFRRWVDIVMHKIFGNWWTPLYSSVTFSNTPYARCVDHKEWQDRVIRISMCVLIAFGMMVPILYAT